MLFAFLVWRMRSTCLALVRLGVITIEICRGSKKQGGSRDFLLSDVSSLIGTDILLITLCLCSGLRTRDQVSHPYKSTCHS